MLQRGEVTNPFDAFDQAATRIGEKYAQRSRMRGGGEEVYPGGEPGTEPGGKKAIVGAGAREQGARPARKPARQEVSAEDLEFHQYEFASEATRFTFSAVASPLLPQKSHELETFRQPGINVCNFGRFWSGRRDSNPRPRPWQGRALPLSYTRVRMVAAIGAPDHRAPMPKGRQLCNHPISRFIRARVPSCDKHARGS